ncbi:MAG: metal-sensing transcriptional repressor [Kiritimatiellae bacterium]|nr:metal-sensing transcriptional repressor [Kiritimatiellia bacterium]
MEKSTDVQKLHRRIRKIVGQVQALDRMVEEGAPCEDVLSFVHAAKSALAHCGAAILRRHIRHCVLDGVEHGDAGRTLDDLAKAVDRFTNMY